MHVFFLNRHLDTIGTYIRMHQLMVNPVAAVLVLISTHSMSTSLKPPDMQKNVPRASSWGVRVVIWVENMVSSILILHPTGERLSPTQTLTCTFTGLTNTRVSLNQCVYCTCSQTICCLYYLLWLLAFVDLFCTLNFKKTGSVIFNPL